MFSVVTVEQAMAVITKWVPEFQAGSTGANLLESVNCRLAEDIYAPEALPPFSRSTVDGYAVRAKDTFGVSETTPGFLNVTGEVMMGDVASRETKAGEAVWIPTGGMLPGGADAVVMVEYTEDVGGGLITVHRPVSVGENLILQGEDCAKGDFVLARGSRLRAAEIGLLAGLGITTVKVAARPRVGIISTGDEIVAPDEMPTGGQIRDVNTYALAAQVIEAGGIPACYGIVRDDASKLEEVLEKALAECDMVLLSGGSSVGTRDMTGEVLDRGTPGILFHGVAIRPGKPTLCALIDNKLVFGLPGHPASAMVVFRALVMPLLEWGSYARAKSRRDFPLEAELTQSLFSGPGREDYVRVRLEYQGDNLVAIPVLGKSGLVSTLVEANGMVRIPLEKEGLNGGSRVPVSKL